MRKTFKKVISVLLAAALWFTMIPSPLALVVQAAEYELPTTAPAYAFNKSGGDFKLEVPPNAYESDSVTLVWTKPGNYQDVTEYRILKSTDGGSNYTELSENAWENYITNFAAGPYVDNFYQYSDSGAFSAANHDVDFYTKIQPHCYKVTNLDPDTAYSFRIVSYTVSGESERSNAITVKTRKTPAQLDIEDYGASTSAAWDVNTTAIQKAIDECGPDDEVLVPEGKEYVIGSIFLKDSMTLRIDGSLKAANDYSAYPRTLLMKPYAGDLRTYALINIINYDYEHPFKNVRVVGKGSFDGQGAKDDTARTGIKATPDELGKTWPAYLGTGSTGTNIAKGLLSYTIVNQAMIDEIGTTFGDSTAYNVRPSWFLARGVDGIYVEGVTAYNPSYHGYIFSESKNVVVNNLTVQSFDGNNGDGFEFDNTNFIWAFGNYSNTGDDSYNFAAGQGTEALKYDYTGDLWMFNNYVGRGHGGVTCGSYLGSGIRNILAEDGIFYMTQSPLRIKTNSQAGGDASDVLFRDMAIKDNGEGGSNTTFQFDTAYTDGNSSVSFAPRSEVPSYQRITVLNVTADSKNNAGAYPVNLSAPSGAKFFGNVKDITFENVTFKNYTNNKVNVYNATNVMFDNFHVLSASNAEVADWALGNDVKLSFTNGTEDTDNAFVINAMSAPEWPSGAELTPLASSTNSITLEWPAATDDTAIAKYQVYMNDIMIASPSAQTYTVDCLEPGMGYDFAVEALDATGARTVQLAAALSTIGLADPIVQPVVQNLADLTPSVKRTTQPAIGVPGGTTTSAGRTTALADSIGSTYAQIYWPMAKMSDGSTNYPPFYKFNVYANGDRMGETYQVETGTNACILTGLNPATAYDVTVKLVGLNGVESEASDPLSVTTKRMFDTGVPEFRGGKPNVTDNADGTSVDVTWTAAEDDIAVWGYRVYVDGKLFDATKGGAQEISDMDWLPTAISSAATVLDGQTLTCKIPKASLANGTQAHTVSISAGDKLNLDYLEPTAFYEGGGRSNATTYVSTWTNPAAYSATFTNTVVSNTCTVTFDSQGGSYIPNIDVAYKTKVSKPTNPTKSNYTFGGWYKDWALTNLFDFNSNVESDITLYAKWNRINWNSTNESSDSSSSTTAPTTTPTATPAPAATAAPAGQGAATKSEASSAQAQAARLAADLVNTKIVGSVMTVDKVTVPQRLVIANSFGDDISKVATYVCLLPDGTMTPVPTYIDPVTKQVFVLASANGTYFAVTSVNKQFTDVKTTDWFASAVADSANRLIVQGSGRTFRPYDNVTVAETATMFLRAIGYPVDKTAKQSFSDVAANEWYSAIMATASKTGLLSGTKGTPEATISRADAAIMAAAALKIAGINITISASEIDSCLKDFKDLSGLTPAQKTALAVCVKFGIFVGNGDGTMTPSAILTRAQMTVISSKLCSKIVANIK